MARESTEINTKFDLLCDGCCGAGLNVSMNDSVGEWEAKEREMM